MYYKCILYHCSDHTAIQCARDQKVRREWPRWLLGGTAAPDCRITRAQKGEKKSWCEVVRMLTGHYSYAHADGITHAGARLLSGTVDPIRIPPVAAEKPPRQQQHHHQHLRRPSPASVTVIPIWALDSGRDRHTYRVTGGGSRVWRPRGRARVARGTDHRHAVQGTTLCPSLAVPTSM